MSWASRDPERWDEICRNGIMAKLESRANMGANHFDRDEVEAALIEAMECHALNLALTTWASKEIDEAEGDHFSGLIDAAEWRTQMDR